MNRIVIVALAAMLSATAVSQPPQTSERAAEQRQADAMQQRMRQMRQQMALIQETQDPEERQRLMREHMESMHQSMMAMREGMQGQPGDRQAQQCAQDDTECQVGQLRMHQQMMDGQLGMMQMMMEQMMEQMRLRHQMGTQAEGEDTSASEGRGDHHTEQ